MARFRVAALRKGRAMRVECSPKLLARMLAKTVVVIRGRWECWEWQGHTDDNGYGQVKVDGRAEWVHRVSYAAFRGPIKADYQIDHRCDNPSCWRPHHLRQKESARHARESAMKPRSTFKGDGIPF